MQQAPKPVEATPAKGKKMWGIVGAIVIIVVVLVTGLVFPGFLRPYVGLDTGGTPVSIWEGAGGCGSDCGYRPDPQNVTVGTTVKWTNDGSQPHTATACHTANSPSSTACPTMNAASLPNFDVPGGSGNNLDSGESGSFKFDTPGTYHYYCRVHLQMHGVINVS